MLTEALGCELLVLTLTGYVCAKGLLTVGVPHGIDSGCLHFHKDDKD